MPRIFNTLIHNIPERESFKQICLHCFTSNKLKYIINKLMTSTNMCWFTLVENLQVGFNGTQHKDMGLCGLIPLWDKIRQ